MKKNIFLAVIVCSLVLLIQIAPASGQWDKQEGASNVAEYASDSGNFALVDGFEFTKIRVEAHVQDGKDKPHTDVMYATAYIRLNDGTDVDTYVSSKTNSIYGNDEESGLSGATSCPEWYWTIDARNNPGSGTAWCKWQWE